MSKSKTDLFRLNMNRFNTQQRKVLQLFLDWGQLTNRQKGKHLYVWPNNKHKKRVRVKQYITSIPSRSQGEVNNVDHLLTMHCSAKKPWDLAREWCLTEGTQDVPKQVGSTEAPPTVDQTRLWPVEAWTQDPLSVSCGVWHQGVNPLITVGCKVRPQWIGLLRHVSWMLHWIGIWGIWRLGWCFELFFMFLSFCGVLLATDLKVSLWNKCWSQNVMNME